MRTKRKKLRKQQDTVLKQHLHKIAPFLLQVGPVYTVLRK
jgi:hypothetical protein